MEVCAMGSIRAREDNGNLFFDFRYKGKRCRELTLLPDNKANRKKLEQIMKRIDLEIATDVFNYAEYFPNSPNNKKFTPEGKGEELEDSTDLFKDFCWQWFDEN